MHKCGIRIEREMLVSTVNLLLAKMTINEKFRGAIEKPAHHVNAFTCCRAINSELLVNSNRMVDTKYFQIRMYHA